MKVHIYVVCVCMHASICILLGIVGFRTICLFNAMHYQLATIETVVVVKSAIPEKIMFREFFVGILSISLRFVELSSGRCRRGSICVCICGIAIRTITICSIRYSPSIALILSFLEWIITGIISSDYRLCT